MSFPFILDLFNTIFIIFYTRLYLKIENYILELLENIRFISFITKVYKNSFKI